MTYELALKLKEAGFPQDECDVIYTGKLVEATSDIDGSPTGLMVSENYRAPNLSQLIKACEKLINLGDELECINLNGFEDSWRATIEDEVGKQLIKAKGGTPEEAMARLYLRIVDPDDL